MAAGCAWNPSDLKMKQSKRYILTRAGTSTKSPTAPNDKAMRTMGPIKRATPAPSMNSHGLIVIIITRYPKSLNAPPTLLTAFRRKPSTLFANPDPSCH